MNRATSGRATAGRGSAARALALFAALSAPAVTVAAPAALREPVAVDPAAASFVAPVQWSAQPFRTADGSALDVAVRPSPLAPALYDAVVLPGSGCAGLAPIVAAYFRGLAHGDVAVLHKRHVDGSAWPAPDPCPDAFVDADRHSRWFADADAFLSARAASAPAGAPPLLLIGISEGAELAPQLARAHPEITRVALVASTGADPLVAYEAQAARTGDGPAFLAMRRAAADASRADDARQGGRSLGYWRDLAGWPVTAPLLALDRPVWIAFGAVDAALSADRLQWLAGQATAARTALCIGVFAGADHGLAVAGSDGPLQRFLGWLDAAMLRDATVGDCWPLSRPNDTAAIAP